VGLKNYTSQVPVARSLDFMKRKLVQHGARQIMEQYSVDGRITGLAFILNVDGTEIPFKVPARVEECERILMENLAPGALEKTRKRIPAQAERTAWKIMSDWVEVQMAMVELAQVEVMEVFLPYVYDVAQDRTFFDSLKAGGFKALPKPPKGT
jgi:hypothetical protein